MPDFTVKNKSGKVIFESDILEDCLDMCRKKIIPTKVFKGDVLIAFKQGAGPKRGRPAKKLDESEE